ncbi:MAG: oxaloacetate decarboxylase [Nitrospinota bacterium]
MSDHNARCHLFRKLIRDPEILVMPGAHDALTAQILEAEGFRAVQASSWGIAASYGLPDGGYLGSAESLEAVRRMVRAVDVPVNADGEGGYGNPAVVYRTVSELIQVGAVGMNLEDKRAQPGVKGWRIVDLGEMLEKIDAFLEAKRDSGSAFVLNARTDAFMAHPDDPARGLAEAVARGNAFAEKGADLVFVFGRHPPETVRTLTREIRAPVSITCYPDHLTVPELQDLGVARTSLGTDSVRVAAGAVRRFARALREEGTQRGVVEGALSVPEVAGLVLKRQRPAG